MLGVDDVMDIVVSALTDPDNTDIPERLVPLFDCQTVGEREGSSPMDYHLYGEGALVVQRFRVEGWGDFWVVIHGD